MMLRLLGVAMALLVVPSLARGQERWNVIAEGQFKGARWSYDTVSFARSGPRVNVWLKVEQAEPDTTSNAQLSRSSVVRVVLDCEDRTVETTDDVYYGFDGKVVDAHHYQNPQTIAVVPGSLMEHLLENLCALTSKK